MQDFGHAAGFGNHFLLFLNIRISGYSSAVLLAAYSIYWYAIEGNRASLNWPCFSCRLKKDINYFRTLPFEFTFKKRDDHVTILKEEIKKLLELLMFGT